MALEFWEDFQKVESVQPVGNESLIITQVLDSFGIKHSISNSNSSAGTLTGLDLKRVDAMSIIKASLLEFFAQDSTLTEMCVNNDGEVELYKVGNSSSNFDVYYTISSSSVTPRSVGVSVTGRKPEIQRVIFGWKQIIGPDSYSTIWDATHLNSQCTIDGFTTAAIVTYKDPLLENGTKSYNNGVTNLFELNSSSERIIGFAWKITPPADVNSMVNIIHQNQSSVPILIGADGTGVYPEDSVIKFKLGNDAISPSIGTALRRRAASGSGNNACTIFSTAKGQTPGPLEVTIRAREGLTYTNFRSKSVNKFMGVNKVYVVAIELNQCEGIPITPDVIGKNTAANTVVSISNDNTYEGIFTLTPAEDYLLDYSTTPTTDDVKFNIQFANNSASTDNGVFGSEASFRIDQSATELKELFVNSTGKGTLLPTKAGPGGLLIKQLWMQIDLDTPSFLVNDPQGKAADIARKLRVELTALAVDEQEPPMAINGVLIEADVDDITVDNDPTTTQDFTDTQLEIALAEMDHGRTLSINLGSLSPEQTTTLSANLYSLLSRDDGAVYTHTCGPTSKPVIGTTGPNGGIVNSITYSYNDSGSYLITVVEGPECFGDFGGFGGGVYIKKTETVSASGMIIQDKGNHVEYKVRVDGYGDIWALNTYPGVLDVKDRVNVTINNNEVED